MSKKKKSAVLIESDSDDSDSGKDLEEVTGCTVTGQLADTPTRELPTLELAIHGLAYPRVVQ